MNAALSVTHQYPSVRSETEFPLWDREHLPIALALHLAEWYIGVIEMSENPSAVSEVPSCERGKVIFLRRSNGTIVRYPFDRALRTEEKANAFPPRPPKMGRRPPR